MSTVEELAVSTVTVASNFDIPATSASILYGPGFTDGKT
jgi:hypothetical protein